jgi:hypothetical protein
VGTAGAGTASLSLNGQTLALNGPLAVTAGGSLTVDSGALVGNTNAMLSGDIGWSAGALGGNLTLAAGSTLTLMTANAHNLPNLTLTNNGTVVWATGTIQGGGYGSLVINNGLWVAQDDSTWNDAYGYNAVVFNNRGTFRKTAGTSAGQTLFSGGNPGVVFNQLGGTLDVETGAVSVTGNNGFNSGMVDFGIAAPVNYGHLNVSGGITLGGALTVVLNNGYFPAVSNSFALINRGSRNGTFTSTSLPVNGTYWQVVYANTSVDLVVANNLAQLVNIAYLRSLLDPVNFAPTNTTTVFTTEGVVTTWTNLTGGAGTEFYIQDATAGIAVDWAGASAGASLPPGGSLVQVTAPLGEFNGLLTLARVETNSQEGVTILGGTNLPAPQPLPMAPSLTGNPTLMVRGLQGSYLVASNVFLDLTTPAFAAGAAEPLTNGLNLTNPISFYNPTNVAGGTNFQVSATNLAGETFTLYYNPYTDLAGGPKPPGPFDIYGVLGQSATNPPYTNGYRFTPTRFADLVPVAPPVILWTNPVSISYGTGLSATQLNATAWLAGANVPGSFAHSPAAGAVPAAGTNTLSVAFTPADLQHYNLAAGSASLVVTPVPPAVTAGSASRSYGAANPVFAGTLTGVVRGDGITASLTPAAGPGSAVLTYAITPQFLDSNGRLVNYVVNAANGLPTVTTVPLTVTASNAFRLAGQANPVFTGTLAGVVNGDNITAVYSSPATPASPVGTYPIIPALADPNGRLGNYSVTTNDGTLTVNPTTLSVTWTAPAAILYGTALSGIQLNATSSVPGTPVCTPAAGTVLDAGTNWLTLVYTQVTNQTSAVGQEILIPLQVQAAAAPAFFRLAASDPEGAFISTNGVFRWSPACSQGSTTNQITIWVTDNSSPPLSNSMTFSVVVGECVQLELGSTVMQVGQAGGVPVTLLSTVGLTNLNWTLSKPSSRFTNRAFASSNASIAGATSSQSFFNLNAAPGQTLPGTARLGTIYLTAPPGPSAFLPLAASNILGTELNGTVAGNQASPSARIVVIGTQPLPEAMLGSNATRTLILYDNPGSNYPLLVNTSLTSTNWQNGAAGTATNLIEISPWTPRPRCYSTARISGEGSGGGRCGRQLRGRPHPAPVPERPEIALFAAGDKTFGHGFQLLPAGPDLTGFVGGDLVIRRGGGDDVEQVGKFLDDLVGGGNQEMGMRGVLGVEDEKASGALAEPLDQARVAGGFQEGFESVERVGGAASGGMVRRFRPLVYHRGRQAQLGGDLLRRGLVKHLAQQFVGVHAGKMAKVRRLGKSDAGETKPTGKAFRRARRFSGRRRLESAATGRRFWTRRHVVEFSNANLPGITRPVGAFSTINRV